MNNKGLVNSLIVIMVLLFVFAFASALALKVWGDFNTSIQGLDSSVADNSTKQQIDDLTTYLNWGDKLFTYLIITLIIGFLITSFTLPAESFWLLIIYFGVLLMLVFIGMFVSNTWTVLINDPSLLSTLGSLPFTDFVMRTLPIIVFFVGVLGGLIFYLRARGDSGGSFVGGGDEEF